MTTNQAIRLCEFWTTNLAESVAIGSTVNQEAGETLGFPSIALQQASDPQGPRVWSGNVPRWVADTASDDPRAVVENPTYTAVAREISERSK